MKRIAVLVMYCNSPFYTQEEIMVKDTWAKDIIEHKYPNIQFFSYTASYDGKYHFNSKERRIYVPAVDNIHGTAEKTFKCFKFLKKIGAEFDYVFRTNASTYVNVPLLNEFVQGLYDDEVIWCHQLFSAFIDSGPYEYCVYGMGSCLLMSRKYIDVLTTKQTIYDAYEMIYKDERIQKNPELFFVTNKIDDNAMGYILNTYFLNHQQNHLRHWKKLPVQYCIEETMPVDDNSLTTIYRRPKERQREFQVCPYIHRTHKRLKDIVKLNTDIQDEYIDIFRPNENPDLPSYYWTYDRNSFIDVIKKISKIPYLDK